MLCHLFMSLFLRRSKSHKELMDSRGWLLVQQMELIGKQSAV